MADAAAQHSFDSILYYALYTSGDPASLAALQVGPPWYEIGNVISINATPMERSVTEVTHLRSPNKAKEKVPGFLDGGQQTFKLNYSRALLTTLLAITGGVNAPDTYQPGDTVQRWGRAKFACVFPDRGVWVFTAFIKSLPVEVPEDNRLTIEVTLEINGKPLFYSF